MKFFIWIRRHRAIVNGILFSIISTLFLNTISTMDNVGAKDIQEICNVLRSVEHLSGLMMWGSVVILLIYNLVYVVVKKILSRRVLSKDFCSVMKKYTASSIEDTLSEGTISWGEGKTVCYSNAIIDGWKPEDVIVSTYDSDMYVFGKKKELKLFLVTSPFILRERRILNIVIRRSLKRLFAKATIFPE